MSEAAAHEHHHHPALAHHFESLEEQHVASQLAMWVFLATEVLFFGGLFAGYTIYRSAYPDAFGEASRHLDIVLGGVNTAILLLSSFSSSINR